VTSPSVVVRPAELADEEALTAIDLATWNWLTSPSPVPEPGSGRRFFNERTDPANVLVAVVEGAVAGYIKLGLATELEASAHVRAVHGFAVDPARQRQGIGRALLEGAAEEAKRRGATRLTLRVLGPNEDARRLYESAGFVVEGVLRGEFVLEGREVDDVLMALDLRVPATPP
jgi:ribosomal protein S18 acetylase RimI-like enzyme